MSDQKNLLVALVLSILVLVAFDYFYLTPNAPPPMPVAGDQGELEPPGPVTGDAPVPAGDAPVPDGPRPDAPELSAAGNAAPAPRVRIATPRLTGSISLRGGRIDDLVLADYDVSIEEGSDQVRLLSGPASANPYYAEFGWASRDRALSLPKDASDWENMSGELTPTSPLILRWNNGLGLIFTRTISIDEDYMFTIHQSVENQSGSAVTLAPYGLIARRGTPETSGFLILHEGPLGVFDGRLKETDYDDVKDDGPVNFNSTGGWIGITDKYWLTTLVPDQDTPFNARFTHREERGDDRYQVDYLDAEQTIPAGGTIEITNLLFAGAKEVDLIDRYQEQYNITLFDRTIDWGWLVLLTKPIFHALDFFYGLVGNFGVAILLLTVVIKLIFFPLANKSYVAMSKMKKLAPEMKKIQQRFADDKVRQQQEIMALYKKEKANPAAGCLPMLIQIPVFFALYKVLFITIEMRHQPFFGWIQDLSAADPLLITNLFGLVPWDPPRLIAIGIWPLIMGITMFLQQKLNPQPADPIQAKVFMALPIVFTFILAPFPAGLVIYWSWNNLLSMAQQWAIMRRMGVKAT